MRENGVRFGFENLSGKAPVWQVVPVDLAKYEQNLCLGPRARKIVRELKGE